MINFFDYSKDDSLFYEMNNRKKIALDKLSSVISPEFCEQFSKILHYSWGENLQEAETITNKLDLYPIDFCAILGDLEGFKFLLQEEREQNDAQMEYEYYSDLEYRYYE